MMIKIVNVYFDSGMDPDCAPPEDSCADVEDMPDYPSGYIIYHYFTCKLASIDQKLDDKDKYFPLSSLKNSKRH